MPGDDWQRFANLRLLYSYQFALPGKKLLFMGDELAQWHEWDHEAEIDWALADMSQHAGVLNLVGDLNRLYRTVPALHELDCDPRGFEWTQPNDAESSLLSFLRFSSDGSPLLTVCNFTPVIRSNVSAGVPAGGFWDELFNSDASEYGGGGVGNLGGAEAHPLPNHAMPFSLTLTVPPLACLLFHPR
jgi:1,4-alpha-glucan branching enzyme